MQHLGRAGQIGLDGIPSRPAGLPFFRYLIALLILALTGLFSLTCRGLRGVSAGSVSAISFGRGRLSSSLKCSAHLVHCSSWSVSTSAIGSDKSVCDLCNTFLCSSDEIKFFQIVLACCFLCLSELIQEVPSVFSDALYNLLVGLTVFDLGFCFLGPHSAAIQHLSHLLSGLSLLPDFSAFLHLYLHACFISCHYCLVLLFPKMLLIFLKVCKTR